MVMMCMACLAFTGTFGADALDHIIGGLCLEAIGQLYCWDGDILKAEGSVADFAMEMYVAVVIRIAVSVAEFVSDSFTTVVNLVQEMALIE
jgi:hypothetical protein